MNRVILGAVVICIIVGAVVLFMRGNNNAQSNMQNMHMQSQTQNNTSGSTKPTGKSAVTIQNFAFSSATITVKAGQSVTWTNQDSVGHSATADDASWDTGVLSQGQSKSITFAKAGTYTYHCSVHPNMKATVVVQ